jgi:hypothetical protein
VRATVVLTDGHENHGPYTRRSIDDVRGLIDERVYAIGLGTAEELEPVALERLCNRNRGYLLMTGQLGSDAYFRLAKYYQQILAGVTNNQIVRDRPPRGAPLPRRVLPRPRGTRLRARRRQPARHRLPRRASARPVAAVDNGSALRP